VHQILDGLELPAASRFRRDGPPSGFAAKKNGEGSHTLRALYEKPSPLSTGKQLVQPISCNIS
jgi:hypothetical protein